MAMAFRLMRSVSWRKNRAKAHSGGLTLADIDADTGKGPAADLSDCTFHASTEDFITALRAQRNRSER